MTEQANMQDRGTEWRDLILSNPDKVLEDRDVMRALIEANEAQMGSNIIDMRGLAMERLENRLERLEDTHRSVIAAAYENLAGMNQIHRAILRLMDHTAFEPMILCLGKDMLELLRVECLHLVLESPEAHKGAQAPAHLAHVLQIVAPGTVDSYIKGKRELPTRAVTLRQTASTNTTIFGAKAGDLRSEALIRLDIGPKRLPAMLALGSEDPHQFRASQGTDLLAFFGSAFERMLRLHLG